MSLIDKSPEEFVEEQRERVTTEIDHWEEFRQEHDDSIYLAFSEQRREGQIHVLDNEVVDDRQDRIYDYLNESHVVEIDGVLVDLLGIQIPYNCMWKSCRMTGKYCCKVTSCTANTEHSQSIMREAGQHFIEKYGDTDRIEAIRSGNTHTEKLSHNKRIDGHCVFGEEKVDEEPATGEERKHIFCNLHDAAEELDVPLHYFHSIGPSLFPADILIVDGQWFVTAAHSRVKEIRATRWWVTSDDTICTSHGDTSDLGILQHPDFDAMYADILGRDTLDKIQKEAYGESGPVEPNIQDGWIHEEERGLERYQEKCRSCEGEGCDKCDHRGYFVNWKNDE